MGNPSMKNVYIRLLFLGIVVVLISVSLLTFRNLNNYVEEVHAIRHSIRVMSAVQEVLLSVKDAETGHRGFQLTRDTAYLEPYYNSLRELPERLGTLDSLLSLNPVLSKKVDTLGILLENHYALISQILSNASKSSLYMDRYESSLLGQGKKNMDDIRRVTQDIIKEEQGAYQLRMTFETSMRNVAPIALLVYTLTALAAVTFLFVRILDALNKRHDAEDKLTRNVEALRREVLIREEREILLRDAEAMAHMGSWRWYGSNNQIIWSDGLYQIWGVGPGSFLPSWESFLNNVYEEDRPAVQSFIDVIRTAKVREEVNFRIEIAGQLKHIWMAANPKEEAGRGESDLQGMVMDITRQKTYESQLKQFTLELQRSNQDLEQFAYVASHDLQEPLRKIRAFGDRLTARYGEGLEGPGVDYINRMQSASARMQSLIEELLSFSRVSRPGIVIEKLDMNELMKEVLDDLDAQIRREKADIRVSKIPPIRGEHTQLKRLFQNLISNGIKFHKPGKAPRVQITCKTIRGPQVSEEFQFQATKPEYVKIEVKDNGIGFDEKYKEKIFNIFQRLHGRAEFEGTGIGLAICRKIVTNHGGMITATSEEGAGSEFIVILPID
jgi:signal transduction histidine kinase